MSKILVSGWIQIVAEFVAERRPQRSGKISLLIRSALASFNWAESAGQIGGRAAMMGCAAGRREVLSRQCRPQ